MKHLDAFVHCCLFLAILPVAVVLCRVKTLHAFCDIEYRHNSAMWRDGPNQVWIARDFDIRQERLS